MTGKYGPTLHNPKPPPPVLASSLGQDSGDPLEALRTNIPGEPGLDYPIHASVQVISWCRTSIIQSTPHPLQETAFSCDGKQFGGYYANPKMDCQAYHICLMVRREGGTARRKWDN